MLKQGTLEEQHRSGQAIHFTFRIDDRPGMPAVEFLHSGEREIEGGRSSSQTLYFLGLRELVESAAR